MFCKSLRMGALLILAASAASAKEANLRCSADGSSGTLSLKINYGASRITEITDYMEPGKPRGGPDMAADGSIPARITDAQIYWATTQNGEWYEKYQLDRSTWVLRMDLHAVKDQFPTFLFQCREV